MDSSQDQAKDDKKAPAPGEKTQAPREETPAHGEETHRQLVKKDKEDVMRLSKRHKFVLHYCKEVKIILQVVNENERLATFSKMEPISVKLAEGNECLKLVRFTAGVQGFDRNAEYTLGVFGGYKTALVQTAPGQKCQPEIESAISQFPNAALIIGVGVAYGRDRKTQKLGDVLVSQNIVSLGTIKVHKEGEIINRDTSFEVAAKFCTCFCKAYNRFYDEFACTNDSLRHSMVHVGTLTSGSILLNNEDFKKNLLANAPEAIGGEMEGYVLMKITKERNSRKVEAIIIKGVCDYGDGTKEKSWQLTAALAAVKYAHLRLEETEGLLFETEDEEEPPVTPPPYTLQQKAENGQKPHLVDLFDGPGKHSNTAEHEKLPLTLPNVENELKDVIKWELLGQNLNIPDRELANIKEDDSLTDMKARKRAMLKWWLDNDKDASGSKLGEALKRSCHGLLAETIKTKFR